MQHLQSMTSIISLLSQKHPSSKKEFLILRQALSEWYSGVEEKVL